MLPQFKSRTDYLEKVKPRRLHQLRELIQKHNPPTIIAHGKEYWPEYKSLFDGWDFKQHRSFEVANTGRTMVVLTGQFAHQSMNGKFDEIAEMVRNVTYR